jgi:hypothetical protein
MRYYPKRGFGIELSHFDIAALDELESGVQQLRESGDDDAANKLEESGPEGPWNAAILEAIRDWSGDQYDDFIFDEINSWHEVVPMRIGALNDERGGETTGVSGFEQGVEYLIFDLREQDDDSWKQFKAHLEEHGIELIEGSWSQLG